MAIYVIRGTLTIDSGSRKAALTFDLLSPKDAGVLEGGQARARTAARWGSALLIALAFAALASIRLDRPGFFDNEGRYAEVAREMLVRHDLVTPEMNETLFLNKPPLMFWLAAGAFALGAADEWARITSVLAGAFSVLLTCRLGARLFDPSTGLLAGAFLATTFGFVLEARALRPDGVLVAAVLAALCCWRAAEDAPETGRGRWLVLGYVALATGFMAKGAVPVAVAAIPVIACTVRDHGWRGLGRLRPLLGLAVFFVVAAPWHVAVAARHPGFAWDYVVNQHLLFAFDKKLPRDSEGDPLIRFWSMFLSRSLPWIALVPLTVREALRGSRRAAPVPAQGSFLCWSWMGGVMLLFSLTPSRLEHYALPALPSVALLAARGWQRLRAGAVGGLGWAWLGAVATAFLAAGGFGIWRGRELLGRLYWIGDTPLLMSLVLATATVALLGGLVLGGSAVLRRPGGVVAGLAVVGIPALAIVVRAQAEVEPVFSWKPLALSIVGRVPDSAEIVFEAPEEYQQVGGLAYYTRRRIAMLEPDGGFTPPTYLEPYRDTLFLTRAEFAQRWNGPDTLAFVSNPQSRRDTPEGLVPGPFHVLARSGDRWLLINRPPNDRSAG
jgi:4-amino-4-deoxy-L-arabinose transferase-like glycosyltransferase